MRTRHFYTPLLILIMIAIQFFGPITVHADGGTTPPAEEPAPESQEEAQDVEEQVPAMGEVTDEAEDSVEPISSPDESAELVEPAVESVAEEIETEDLTVAEALVQSPEGTEIAVVNEEGEFEPLATEEAAEIVATADPIWCPDVQAPTTANAGVNCSPSYSTMTELVTWLNANDASLTQDGTIWIEKTYDSSGEGGSGFTLDGSSFTNFDTHTLTIQGGWDGLDTITVDTSDPSEFNGHFLHITNWNASVTINDIAVDGATSDGIVVSIASGSGDINLENVTSSNNTGADSDGAELTNTSGTGNITLTGTNVFNNNADDGLEADSNGDISINNVTASDNGEDGVDLDNCQNSVFSCTGSGKISINGTNVFNGNDGFGLVAATDGDISADSSTSITVNNNGIVGALLDNEWLGSTGEISLLGTNVFNSNDQGGLYATSLFNITLNNVTANENKNQFGAFLGSVYGDINLTGTNTFNNNFDDHGLYIDAFDDVAVNNVTANSNGSLGAVLYSDDGAITLTGTNAFNNNFDHGLFIDAFDDVSVNNVTANSNGGLGAYLYSDDGSIQVTGTNVFKSNFLDGLYADAYMDISLNNISANKNNGTSSSDGAEIFSDSGGVILTGTNTFRENGDDGLEVDAWTGATISNVTAKMNGEDGLDIDVDNGNIVLSNIYTHSNGQEGAELIASGDASVTARGFFCNGTYGIDASQVSGTFTLNTVQFGGNKLGAFSYSGTPSLTKVKFFDIECGARKKKPVTYPTKPINQVDATGAGVGLDCDQYKGTQLNLPNGDFAYFPCPIQDSASLTKLEPENVPEELTSHSGFSTGVIQNGLAQEKLGKYVTVSFAIPDGVDLKSLSILYWDGSDWVELSTDLDLGGGKLVGLSGYVSAEGTHFQARVNFSGDFVLVSK